MNKSFEYFIIIFLFVISLIYTNNINDIVKDKDPIMIKIKEVSEVIDTESINAIINDDELVTGISGCSVDINKSYENMKKLNNYSDKMLKYKDLIPKITSIDYYDKYITGGNNLNRNISIVVYIKDSLDKLKGINDIRLNLFLDGMLLKDSKINIPENIRIFNGGIDSYYDDVNIEWINDVIESNYNESLYCLNILKDNDSLINCSKNKMYTITPKLTAKDIYNLKKNIKNGSIIYFDENSINKLEYVSNYILKKGYNIVFLEDLLNEKKCKQM